MNAKKIIGKLHLWLGFISGLLVFIISITGCIYAFQEEIQNLTQNYRFVESSDEEYLPPSVLGEIAQNRLPGLHMHAVKYSESHKAAQAIFFSFEPSYYYIIYLNPYNGNVIKVKNMDNDFFRIVLMGHFYLWLPPEIGQPLVASATLVFIVMLISGIILWWPKNKGAAKQRFTLKLNSGWRRKNYDLHNVLGFYSSFIVLILCLTGLVWGFEWFRNSLHTIAGGSKSLEFVEPLSPAKKVETNDIPATDAIYDIVKQEYPLAKSIEVHFPVSDSSSIEVAVNPEDGTYWKMDYRYYDQYTLDELKVGHIYGKFNETNFGDKLIRMNYDIHTGAILGLPGKILAFFASLIFGSLPLTGFYIWWGRRNKTKKKQHISKNDGTKSAQKKRKLVDSL